MSEIVSSSKPRLNPALVPDEDRLAIGKAITGFAMDLYRELGAADKNLFFSPYGISIALAMTYAGARGVTATEMAETCHFPLPQDRFHQAVGAFETRISNRLWHQVTGPNGKLYSVRPRLEIVNAMWGQWDGNVKMEFLDVLAESYGANLNPMNFAQDAEAARHAINESISGATRGPRAVRIRDLIPAGTITPLTRLILTNAIYFYDDWRTQDDLFFRLDGSSVSVPLMFRSEHLEYADGDGWQAVALPYKTPGMSMLIIKPALGQFARFGDNLNVAGLGSLIDGMRSTEIDLTMPRFKFDAEFGLRDTLSDMGMPLSFTDGADFSGISPEPLFQISDVIHKAFISVDETGTEAAAATGMMVPVGAIPTITEIVEMKLDRPFIFMIRDEYSDSILFMGSVMDPAA